MSKGAGADTDKWVLYFKGGGWCYNEKTCAQRAKTSIGSAKYFTKTFAFSGLMDSNATVNPTFANFNRTVESAVSLAKGKPVYPFASMFNLVRPMTVYLGFARSV